MPVPVVVGLVALFQLLVGHLARLATIRGMGWLAASAAMQGWNLGNSESYQKFKSTVYDLGVSVSLEFCGLELDRSDPFSDKSMCNALGKKTGIELRTLKDKDSIRKDVEHWGLARLEEKTGLHIRDIRSKEKTKKDLMKFVSPVVANATGLPLTDISDAEKTKTEVTEHLEERALLMLADDLTTAKTVVRNALESTGLSLERLSERIEKAGGYTADGRPAIKVDLQLITLGIVSRALINADRRRREREAEYAQCGRRVEQLRGGLKRFREKHGSRMTYERIR